MKWMETWDIISAGLDLSNTFDNETPIPTENSYRAVFLSFDIVCRLFLKKKFIYPSLLFLLRFEKWHWNHCTVDVEADGQC